jgi:peptide chain release factor 1
MLEKLELIRERYIEVSKMIVDPEIVTDMKRYVKLNKEYKNLGVIVTEFEKFEEVISNIKNNKEIVATEEDPEFKEMAADEIKELEPQKIAIEEKLKQLLVPRDPEDEKNCVMEFRAGTGGDEASIFAGDLFRMYTKYCEGRGWKVSVMDVSYGTQGGYKEVIIEVEGDNVYGELKFEAGVHRVQRVPQTETQGRVHTSAATVMVLPEADEFDVEIRNSDIRKDLYCASGPGGQSVNTTYSAVRLTHLPTGIVAQCQDQKSQPRNYDKALQVLRSRIYDMELQKKLAADSVLRQGMVSSGDRSAKIRTYNYPQGRVTDHRIGFTVYNLPTVMDGDIQKFVDELKLADNTAKLHEGQ